MQEHVKLEISLELIVHKITKTINLIKEEKSLEKKKTLEMVYLM